MVAGASSGRVPLPLWMRLFSCGSSVVGPRTGYRADAAAYSPPRDSLSLPQNEGSVPPN